MRPCPARYPNPHVKVPCDLFNKHDGPHANLDYRTEWANQAEKARNGHYDRLFIFPELTDEDAERHDTGEPA